MLTPRLALVCAILLAAPAGHAQDNSAERSALPSADLLWGSKMTVENQACCAASQGITAAEPAEAAVLATVRDRASRDGPILRLRLQGNRTLKITDCDNQEACEGDRFRVHRLVAWWPAQRIYVVNVGLYEDSLAYLISERDGRTTQVSAPPVLSPSGRRAVALQSNLMSGVDLNIVDLATDPPTVVEVVDMPACAGSDADAFLRPKPVWVDDSRVRFEGVSPQPGDNPNTKQLLRIGSGKPAWEC